MNQESPYPDWLNSTLTSDATGGLCVMPGFIQSLKPNCRVVGPAFTVLACQDDNLAVVRAIAAPPPPGSVIIVAGMSTSRTATIGGLMGLEIQNLGVVGLVTDGLIRDAVELRELDLQVWCRGTTPIASAKRNPGELSIAITLGNALVRDGDLVIADDDGVVVWPKEDIEKLLEKAKEKLDKDNARLARLLASGENKEAS
jgi:4-hydroxy-4-methyl-2-oxoglutarate aldolase